MSGSVRNALNTGNKRNVPDHQPGEPVIVGYEQVCPRRGSASQLNGVGGPQAFTTPNVSCGGVRLRGVTTQHFLEQIYEEIGIPKNLAIRSPFLAPYASVHQHSE
jgi:hypothetical protein